MIAYSLDSSWLEVAVSLTLYASVFSISLIILLRAIRMHEWVVSCLSALSLISMIGMTALTVSVVGFEFNAGSFRHGIIFACSALYFLGSFIVFFPIKHESVGSKWRGFWLWIFSAITSVLLHYNYSVETILG